MYVLVRRDLDGAHRTVQACHSVASFMAKFGNDPVVQKWANDDRYLIALGVENERSLQDWEKKLDGKAVAFREPDRNNEVTALAIHPAIDKKLFRGLPLL